MEGQEAQSSYLYALYLPFGYFHFKKNDQPYIIAPKRNDVKCWHWFDVLQDQEWNEPNILLYWLLIHFQYMLCIYFIKLYVINSQNNPLTGIIH